jgi:uncharacterized repeat protein (TIGR01451 family)
MERTNRALRAAALPVCLGFILACGGSAEEDARRFTTRRNAEVTETCPPAPAPTAPLQLKYQGAIRGKYGDALPVAAVLTDGFGAPIAGAQLTFTLEGHEISSSTGANGAARAEIVPASAPGTATLSVSFAGDAAHDPATTTATVTIDREDTVVRYAGPMLLDGSAATAVHATLRENDGSPIAGRLVTFQIGSTSASATTDAIGRASANIAAGASPATATVSFAGDALYKPASHTMAVTAFERSGFAIWGGNPGGVQLGAHVNFWGAQWAAQVASGDYAANPSFKGYIAQLAGPGLCQPGASSTGTPQLDESCWITKPGNSSPPETLAPVIGVVVSTSIVKSGPRIFGNVARYAAVKIDQPSTYGSSPGHEGWGTVIGFVSGGPGTPALAATQSQPASLFPGQDYAVSVQVTNAGNASAANVQLAEGLDLLPLGSIAAGSSANASLARTAPIAALRFAQETSNEYSARLGALDGQLIGNVGVIQSDDGAGRAQPLVDVFSASRLRLPRFTTQIDAPPCVGPGQTVMYMVTLRNLGSAVAPSATATVELPDGTSTTLSFGPIAAGASAQQSATWLVPVPASREESLVSTVDHDYK